MKTETEKKYLLKKKYSVRCKVAMKLAYAACHDFMIQTKATVLN